MLDSVTDEVCVSPELDERHLLWQWRSLHHSAPHHEPRAAEVRHEAWLVAWKRPKLCVLGGRRVLSSSADSCGPVMG